MTTLKVEPEVAIAKIKAGEVVWFKVKNIMDQLGHEGASELMLSLQTGEVQAYAPEGKAMPRHADEFMLRSDDLIKWMASR